MHDNSSFRTTRWNNDELESKHEKTNEALLLLLLPHKSPISSCFGKAFIFTIYVHLLLLFPNEHRFQYSVKPPFSFTRYPGESVFLFDRLTNFITTVIIIVVYPIL